MNFEELQMKLESCRVYADRPVTREQLVHLVDVARFAPLGYCPVRACAVDLFPGTANVETVVLLSKDMF